VKAFKSIDFFIQAGLLLLTAIALILNDPGSLNPAALILIFAGWQILSILVNLAAGEQTWKIKALRKYHLLGIAAVIVLLIIATVQSSAARTGDKDDKYSMAGLGTVIVAAIPAILVSLFYVFITFLEWRKIKK
jgi:hypothetical protein